MRWPNILRFAWKIFNPAQSHSIEVQEKVIVKVLFVCMGNICRSPMAEGIFRHMLEAAELTDRVYVDSAGTHAYHIKSPPDKRGLEIAARRGMDLKAIRARQVVAEDFENFDYLLAMDYDNYQHLIALCPRTEWREKIHLLMDYAPDLSEREVPDPYYGSLGGFERVMDLLEAAVEGFVLHIRERYRV